MKVDEGLVNRVRETLLGEPGLSERKVFGAHCFLLDGHICSGVSSDSLIARVPIERYKELLEQPGITHFPSVDRPMRGWLNIDPEIVTEDHELAEWISAGISVARSLPPK